jgi:hypothetical protein
MEIMNYMALVIFLSRSSHSVRSNDQKGTWGRNSFLERFALILLVGAADLAASAKTKQWFHESEIGFEIRRPLKIVF